MLTLEQLRTGDAGNMTVALSYMTEALIRTARLALENETTGEQTKDCAANTLEVAELLMELLMEGCEGLEQDAKRGTWTARPAADQAA